MKTDRKPAPITVDPALLRILIVDDEPMLRSVIHDFLEMLGYSNHSMAGDGLEALESIRSAPVDLMLSDIRMPRMELQEVLQVVRHEAPGLSVIATSGYSDFDSAFTIFSEGAHDFLGKPLDLNALESSLRWILERRLMLERVGTVYADETLGPGERQEQVLEEIRASFTLHAGCFRRNIDHALRIHDLINALNLPFDETELFDLRAAAMLHECGMSHHMQSTCREPRRFDVPERRLFGIHTRNSGVFAGRALGRDSVRHIIAEHLNWQHSSANQLDGWPSEELGAIWLGLFNTIDGCLQPRPDRTGIPLANIQQSLERRREQFPSVPLVQLLDQWDKVEAFYRGR